MTRNPVVKARSATPAVIVVSMRVLLAQLLQLLLDLLLCAIICCWRRRS